MSDVTVRLQGPATTGGDPLDPFVGEVRILPSGSTRQSDSDHGKSGSAQRGDGGVDIILWDVVGVASPESNVLVLRFAPSSRTEQLQGEPSHLFNRPDPGEDLILRLPALAPGSFFDETLLVDRSDASIIQITVKIKHEI